MSAEHYLIVDDHPMVRAVLCRILSSVVGAQAQIHEAENLLQARSLLEQEIDFALILLDLQLPDSQGTATIHQVRSACPGVPLAVISGSDHWQQAYEAYQAGAISYIPKSSKENMIASVIRLILEGGAGYWPPQVFEVLLGASVVAAETEPVTTPNGSTAGATVARAMSAMAPRQREILQLMAKGMSNKEIGVCLGIAWGTVKNQVVSILRILGAKNRSQAVMLAQQHGLVQQVSLQ